HDNAIRYTHGTGIEESRAVVDSINVRRTNRHLTGFEPGRPRRARQAVQCALAGHTDLPPIMRGRARALLATIPGWTIPIKWPVMSPGACWGRRPLRSGWLLGPGPRRTR